MPPYAYREEHFGAANPKVRLKSSRTLSRGAVGGTLKPITVLAVSDRDSTVIRVAPRVVVNALFVPDFFRG